MFLKLKNYKLLLFILFIVFGFLVFFNSNDILKNNYVIANDANKLCTSKDGAKCMTHFHDLPYGYCTVDGKPGRIEANLCFLRDDPRYNCCIPIDKDKNKLCENIGGECIYVSDPSQRTCIVGNKKGTIRPGLCLADSSPHYGCCEPDKIEGKDKEGYPLASERGCENSGGECQWTLTREGDEGFCRLSNGQKGCFVDTGCNPLEGQNYLENKIFRCCLPLDDSLCKRETAEEQGKGKVDYEKWEHIITNLNCPFSRANPSEDRIRCTQGPYTGSHSGAPGRTAQNAVDIWWRGESDYGSEYFIAPDNGTIINARASTTNRNMSWQKCGGTLHIETEGGITYYIRHAFIFASLQKEYDPVSGEPFGEKKSFKEGEVLAKIALSSDNHVISFCNSEIAKKDSRCNPSRTCTTGPHFHVEVVLPKVDGKEKCADCHFVDDLNCNLQYDDHECSPGVPVRCGRSSWLSGGDCWFGAKCKPGYYYCCDADCEEIPVGPTPTTEDWFEQEYEKKCLEYIPEPESDVDLEEVMRPLEQYQVKEKE